MTTDTLRRNARTIWYRSQTRPVMSPEERRDIEMAISDLEAALQSDDVARQEAAARSVA